MITSKLAKLTAAVSLAIAGFSASNVWAEAPGAIRFSNLEFNAPRDPLLWSSTPLGARQQTPAAQMTYALAQLRAAIPNGLPALEAQNRLQAAGSHCDTQDPSAITCRYNDVETRDGEYLDYVVWKVTVPLVNNHVADIKVARDWYRS